MSKHELHPLERSAPFSLPLFCMELTYKIEAPGAVLLRTGSHDSSLCVPEAGFVTEFLPGNR